MDRRAFVIGLGALLATPLAVEAQQAGRTAPRIGILSPFPSPAPTVTFDELRLGLRNLGYIEGDSIRFDYAWSSGYEDDRFPALATELVARKVDIIVAATVPAIRAAQHATSTIPIVMTFSSDPVRLGLVKSLAHPGGNTTGLASLAFDLAGKRLALLKEAIPKLSQVAVLFNPQNPAVREGATETEIAARAVGVRTDLFEVQKPTDFDGEFAAIRRLKPDGLIVIPDPLVAAQSARIEEFTSGSRLPAMYGGRSSNGLMSYGADWAAHLRDAAKYVDKILRGVKPDDLPVEQPTKFELVINLKTAKALGLTNPPSLLLRADQVIEQ